MCKRLLVLIPFVLMLVLSTNASGQATGSIMREVWEGIGGTSVSDLTGNANYPDNPTWGSLVTSLEQPEGDLGSNFGSRIHGYLHPATSGDYTFWIAADDGCELLLSTDADPANGVNIAGHNSWTSSRQWDKFATQKSAPVSLVGGGKYHIMAIFKEGGGGDNVAVAWEGPDSPAMSVIDGAFLSPAAWAAVLLKASAPIPADGAIDADASALEWTAGPTAVTDKVYLSTDDVIGDADLIGETDLGIQVATLDPGVTYYWRIDGVEADGNVVTGDVWTFSTLPLEAHFPSPGDGAVNVLSGELSWTGGKNSIFHNVSFGTNPAALLPVSMMQMPTTYDAGALQDDTTYYWRVDEFTPAGTITGPVWSFSTPPTIAITDPNLVGLWTFETGSGTTVLDWSGHGNHGLISGAANQQYVAGVEMPWMPGLSNSALEFFGDNQGFVELPAGIITTAKGTIAMWINTTQGNSDNNDEGMLWWASAVDAGDGYGGQNEIHLNIDDPGSGQLDFFLEEDGGGSDQTQSYNNIGGTGWRHVAATWDLTDGMRLYVDGLEVDSDDHNGNVKDIVKMRLGRPKDTGNGNRFYEGLMDEVMLYDYALSADAIAPLGRDITLPYDPDPSDGANNQPTSKVLAWSAGDGAVEQDVYLGTDADAVAAADVTDATGIYRGRQAEATYAPADLVFGSAHYWRVDQVAADGSIVAGPVWTFDVPDFLPIDMSSDVLAYDLTVDPFLSELAWDIPATMSDWTAHGVTDLSLKFRGEMPAPGSSTFDAATGTYEITAAGADIWGSADEFQYVYRELTGDGSMTLRVTDNGTGSNGWAKCGPMIRQNLTQGSVNAMGAITGGSGDGGTFQWRDAADAGSGSSRTLTGIAPPYWVRLTRVGDVFNCEMSADGVTWEPEGDGPHTVVMTDPVFIGIAMTSHQSGEKRTYVVDNVSTTGNVTGEETSANVGVPANDPAAVYVFAKDAAGNTALVVHPDPAATLVQSYVDWKIPLSDLAAQGVDLTAIAQLFVGVGDGTAGGTGEIRVDDIMVVLPAALLSVVRLGGNDGDRDPIGVFDGATAPLATEAGGLMDGNMVFSDRTYPWAGVPAEYVGSEYIRTFNTDKNGGTLDVTYEVTISRPATLWITIDDRIPADWDGGGTITSQQDAVDLVTAAFAAAGTFVDTGIDLAVRERDDGSRDRPMSVFAAELPAGTYVFGSMDSGKNFYSIGAVE